MKRITMIVRADDAGSSIGANAAIERVLRAGFIKNVSVMAPGRMLRDAAEWFGHNKKACFGMHATINAEWDRVKWGPVGNTVPNAGLTDENGWFFSDPKAFLHTKPDVSVILREYDAQLDLLTREGFDIRYVDSHMFPERCVPGLDEAVRDWAVKKGLLDHMYFYRLPPGWERVARDRGALPKVLRELPQGQYFCLAHPALYGEEMLQTGNATESGEKVAKERAREAKLFSNPLLRPGMRLLSIVPIRYDQAVPNERLTMEDVMRLFA